MKLLIDEKSLKYLLETKRDCIGFKLSNGIEDTFAGIGFLASLAVAEYKDLGFLSGEIIKVVLAIIGIAYSFRGIIMIVKNVKEPYNQNDMYNDIKKLDEVTHPFSVVAIKDTFNEYPNRYLLYYDERWDCKFFPSYKTVDNNEDNIKSKLSSELKVDESKIKLEFKTFEIQKKFSVSHNEDRVYDHRAYVAQVTYFSDLMKKDEFEIEGKKYCWMTIHDMEKDERIMQINADVVGLIKGL